VTCFGFDHNKVQSYSDFPDEKTFQKKTEGYGNSVIFYTQEELKEFLNPVCLISVCVKPSLEPTLKRVSESNLDYYMGISFSVQFS